MTTAKVETEIAAKENKRANGLKDEKVIEAFNLYFQHNCANRYSLVGKELLDHNKKKIGSVALNKGDAVCKLDNGKTARILISDSNGNLNAVARSIFEQLEQKLHDNLPTD